MGQRDLDRPEGHVLEEDVDDLLLLVVLGAEASQNIGVLDGPHRLDLGRDLAQLVLVPVTLDGELCGRGGKGGCWRERGMARGKCMHWIDGCMPHGPATRSSKGPGSNGCGAFDCNRVVDVLAQGSIHLGGS